MKRLTLVLAALLALAGCATQKKDLLAVPAADAARADLAVLVLPEALDLEMVDGLVYPGFRSMFRRGDIRVKVLPGQREVALRYNQVFELSNSQHEVVKSNVIVLQFLAEPGQEYRAVHPPFRDAKEARAGMLNFTVTVEDAGGANRVVQASQVQTRWGGQQVVTTRQDLVSPEAAAAAPAAATAPAAPGALNALELLKFSWQGATAGDRAAFLEWVRQQP